ncbi:uncharacterized protein LOC109722075 [Ananas comosus]|uniref:Uncharacterized protein LOC109722075 n=1 Tax=Ananas comosus TaxID=4615 RepID=A0A6P5GAA0_ANACO|nr:uncharacterized protein LOC109722075 [Ananas comosus]
METRAQELKKMEEMLRQMIKESATRQEQSIQELRDWQNKDMEEVRQMFVELHTSISPGTGQILPSAGRSEGNSSNRFHFTPRFTKIEFPRFDGEDLKGWLFRCEQFFEVDGTSEEAKVRLAAIHLEGKALQWHQIYMKSRLTRSQPTWEEYVVSLNTRFGADLFDDPMAELKNLKQTGTVMEYQDKFDTLLNRVELSEEYAVSCFLSGLKEEIQIPIRMFQPRTLQRALSLAKLQELAVDGQGKVYKGGTRAGMNTSSLLSTPKGFNNSSMSPAPRTPRNPNHQGLLGAAPMPIKPARNVSNAAFDERRAKGLCFWCEEKYSPGHQCKKKQLYKIELLEEGSTDNTNSNEESESIGEVELEPVECAPQISLHALAGQAQLPDYRTMRLCGTVKNRRIHILIDSGSTHNFLDAAVAAKLGCCAENIPAVNVTVADGNKLISSSTCRAFKWKMQGLEFKANLLLLPLRGCDMVLGVQWLKQLGPILWDFSKLRMEFQFQGQKIVLRGSSGPSLKIIEGKQLKKMVLDDTALSAVHLCSIHATPQEGNHIATSEDAETTWSGLGKAYSQQLQLLLEEHSDLFEEPQGLPPIPCLSED